MDKLPQISEAEYEIMKILWESHPLSTNEICERAVQTTAGTRKPSTPSSPALRPRKPFPTSSGAGCITTRL